MMNICLLTDEQKDTVFVESDHQYTAKDIDDLAIIADAEKTLINIMQCFIVSNGSSNTSNHMINILNILEWLNAPVASFLCDASLWGNVPESMKEATEEKED
jgi:hypothetical protein